VRAAMWWIDRWRQSDAFARMTAEEQGLYRNLCDEVVLRDDGVIPDDQRILAKASGDHEAWARSGKSVLKSMNKVPGGWTNDTAMSVKNESERRSKSQSEKGKERASSASRTGGKFTSRTPAEPPAEDQPEGPAAHHPPEQEQEKERKQTPEQTDPGRFVKAESTATPDGTPLSLPDGFEPAATAPRRLTPQALGIRVDPGNFAQVQLGHDLTALVTVEWTAQPKGRPLRDPKPIAVEMLHAISATPAGKRIETLDLRRVSTEWAAISSHAAYKLAAEVYGVDLANVNGPLDRDSAVPKSPTEPRNEPEPKRPTLELTVAPGSCPTCGSPVRHSREGGAEVLRCSQEAGACEWAAVWREVAA